MININRESTKAKARQFRLEFPEAQDQLAPVSVTLGLHLHFQLEPLHLGTEVQ